MLIKDKQEEFISYLEDAFKFKGENQIKDVLKRPWIKN